MQSQYFHTTDVVNPDRSINVDRSSNLMLFYRHELS